MTEASDAYAEAQRLIADAAKSRANTLSFVTPKTNALTHIPPEIRELDALTALELRNTEVADLSPIVALTSLTRLSVSGSRVTDLTPIAHLTSLTTLVLNNSWLTDLTPIAALTSLKILYLNDSRVSDLAPIAALRALTRLELSETSVADLTPVTALTALTTLILDGSKVSDLTPIATLTNLSYLDLQRTAVTDLRPLLTLKKLISEPRVFDGDYKSGGLTFANTPACQDPRIAKIAEIGDPAARAETLFEYLRDWITPAEFDAPESHPDDIPSPSLPLARPAPVLAIVTDEGIDLARGTGLLHASDAATRAQKGWQTLKAFRDSLGAGFQLQNYAPLPAILIDFDNALGGNYESSEPIAIGVHGLRLIALSRNADFLANLPTGADSELTAFSAAVSLYVDRFPDWVAFKEDAPNDRPDVHRIPESQVSYSILDGVIMDTPPAGADLKAAFHQLVVIGSQPNASEVEARAMLTSSREIFRSIAENSLADVKSGRTAKELAQQMTEVGQTEWPKLKYKAGGFALDMLGRSAPALRKLAITQPRTFGWVIPVLDYFGFKK